MRSGIDAGILLGLSSDTGWFFSEMGQISYVPCISAEMLFCKAFFIDVPRLSGTSFVLFGAARMRKRRTPSSSSKAGPTLPVKRTFPRTIKQRPVSAGFDLHPASAAMALEDTNNNRRAKVCFFMQPSSCKARASLQRFLSRDKRRHSIHIPNPIRESSGHARPDNRPCMSPLPRRRVFLAMERGPSADFRECPSLNYIPQV